jgi:hypothetical protein
MNGCVVMYMPYTCTLLPCLSEWQGVPALARLPQLAAQSCAIRAHPGQVWTLRPDDEKTTVSPAHDRQAGKVLLDQPLHCKVLLLHALAQASGHDGARLPHRQLHPVRQTEKEWRAVKGYFSQLRQLAHKLLDISTKPYYFII